MILNYGYGAFLTQRCAGGRAPPGPWPSRYGASRRLCHSCGIRFRRDFPRGEPFRATEAPSETAP